MSKSQHSLGGQVEKICLLESNPAVDSNLESEEQHENNNPNLNDSSCDDEVEQH